MGLWKVTDSKPALWHAMFNDCIQDPSNLVFGIVFRLDTIGLSCSHMCPCVLSDWAWRRMSVFYWLWGRTGNGIVILKPDFNKGKEPYRQVHSFKGNPSSTPLLFCLILKNEKKTGRGVLLSRTHALLAPLLVLMRLGILISIPIATYMTCRIETNGEKKEVWRLTLENVSTPMAAEDKEREAAHVQRCKLS